MADEGTNLKLQQVSPSCISLLIIPGLLPLCTSFRDRHPSFFGTSFAHYLFSPWMLSRPRTRSRQCDMVQLFFLLPSPPCLDTSRACSPCAVSPSYLYSQTPGTAHSDDTVSPFFPREISLKVLGYLDAMSSLSRRSSQQTLEGLATMIFCGAGYASNISVRNAVNVDGVLPILERRRTVRVQSSRLSSPVYIATTMNKRELVDEFSQSERPSETANDPKLRNRPE